jgi:hypothetical protein
MKHVKKPATIGKSLSSTPATPPVQTAITIALDTQFLISQPPGTVSQGIYMFDNRVNNGSSGEGSLELTTRCNAGDIISFEVIALNDMEGTLADTVVITGFNVSQGNVFGGSEGMPVQVNQPGTTAGQYWLAQAVNAGTQTYQIFVQITTAGLHPITRNMSWDPFITAQ